MFDQLPAGGKASIVVIHRQPEVVLSGELVTRGVQGGARSDRSIRRRGDFGAAFTLAAGLETPADPIGFVLLSDGGLPAEQRKQIVAGTAYETDRRFEQQPRHRAAVGRASGDDSARPFDRSRTRERR